jgi:hypothetical protein
MSPDHFTMTPGGILVPPEGCKPELDGPSVEYLRTLKRDFQIAPVGTPESILTVYESMASALIEAEHFMLVLPLPDITTFWFRKYATKTWTYIEKAKAIYQREELHLLKPEIQGEDPFRDARHRLDNITQMLSDRISIDCARMFKSGPKLNAAPLLEAMRHRVMEITEIKNAPPKRRGNCWIIEGHDLQLAPQNADVLGFAIRKEGTPPNVEYGTPLNELLKEFNCDSRNEIETRVTRLRKELSKITEGYRITPFVITLSTAKGRLSAVVLQKKLPKP